MYTPSNFKLARKKKQMTHHTNSFLSSDAPNLILLLQEFMNPINQVIIPQKQPYSWSEHPQKKEWTLLASLFNQKKSTDYCIATLA
jgi:hypothetical protein